MYFDKETVDYFNDNFIEGVRGTWAEGNVDPMDCYVDDIIRSLMDKADSGSQDFTDEISRLEQLKEEQKALLDTVIQQEEEGLDTITETLQTLL